MIDEHADPCLTPVDPQQHPKVPLPQGYIDRGRFKGWFAIFSQLDRSSGSTICRSQPLAPVAARSHTSSVFNEAKGGDPMSSGFPMPAGSVGSTMVKGQPSSRI
ncbi:hypothetical protein [Aureimonas sp. Leaf324]|uniref:hypothetical protein n=1 Tax=Aureimonas sp. Leaf324 TaxID=1736336 RepID=UPI00138F098D|nr:hypothetical protein [Aureimonas sp. Leaf324]